MKPKEEKPMTVKDAGHKGGSTTLARHGKEHYEKMSAKGVEARKRIYDAGKKALKEQEGK